MVFLPQGIKQPPKNLPMVCAPQQARAGSRHQDHAELKGDKVSEPVAPVLPSGYQMLSKMVGKLRGLSQLA